MKFTKKEFLDLMGFPKEWLEWDMYPDELFQGQLGVYEPHHKNDEHYRYGAFHYWLKRNPSRDILLKLAKLSWLDSYQIMAADARNYISKAENTDGTVLKAIEKK